VIPNNSLRDDHNLPLLEGLNLKYNQKQISGDSMANSLNGSSATCMGTNAIQECHQCLTADYVNDPEVTMLSLPAHMSAAYCTYLVAQLTAKHVCSMLHCKHISFAFVGLLIPCAVKVAVQAIQVIALVSISLLQSIMKLIKAAPRKRMQCSILYCLLNSGYCVDCTLRQENGSMHF